MEYSLNFFYCCISGLRSAIRHWELANAAANRILCWGHRSIALIQAMPIIGATAALAEWTVAKIYNYFTYQAQQPQLINQLQQRRLQLIDLDAIPSCLENDPILSTYRCSITLLPVRYPVKDPNTPVIYERAAIVEWIRMRHTSPITRLPLQEDQLVPLRAIQSLIDFRLRTLQQIIDNPPNRP